MKSRSLSASISFVVSILVHAGVFALLVALSHRGPRAGEAGMTADGKPIEIEAAEDVSGGGDPAEVALFQGVPYSVYAKKTGKDMLTQGRAAKLMNALNTLNLSGGARKKTLGLKSALDGGTKGLVATATSGSTDSMTKTLRSQRFSFQAAAPVADSGARRMTDKERAELKRNFQALEAEFRKVYAQALNQDPQLEVTVSFEAEIKPTGYLSISSFKAQGKYQQESLALLRTKMSELVAKVFVAKDLAGTLIRGESVFVR